MMADTVRRFSDLIAPVTVEDFTGTMAGKPHLYIPGPDDKFSNVASCSSGRRSGTVGC